MQNPENLSCAGLKQFGGVSLFSEEREGSGGAHVRPPAWGKLSETGSNTGQSGVAWDKTQREPVPASIWCILRKGWRWTLDFSFVYYI